MSSIANDGTASGLIQTTNLSGISLWNALTIAMWIKVTANVTGTHALSMRRTGFEELVFYISSAGGNAACEVFATDQVNFASAATSYQTPGINLWWYAAIVMGAAGAGNAHVYMFDAAGNLDEHATGTNYNYSGNGTMTNVGMFYEIGAGNGITGSIKYPRIWSAALSQSEIAAEQFSHTAVRTSNLWGAWVFNGESDTLDVSGNGHHWSPSGGAGLSTNADEPPVTAPSASNDVPGRRFYVMP